GTVSSFALQPNGQLTELHTQAPAADGTTIAAGGMPEGETDVALSRDNKFLYVDNSEDGSLYVFRTVPNGSLILVKKYDVFNVPSVPDGGQFNQVGMAAF
ncbi:MAG TPA: beta-propeller fold lactonase family protein, partial [Pseudonocardiaceae bacterium]|nr:beta-propeller fold lactonase family protein [Pseudonocardiaceae bacterium]